MATNGNGTQSPDQGFGERIDHLNQSAQQLIGDARSTIHDLGSTLDLRGRVDRNPYGMLVLAAGIGYVLGGGLFTPLTARALRFGMKLAALPLVKDELIGMAEAAVNGFVQSAQDAGVYSGDPAHPNPGGGNRGTGGSSAV